MNTSPEILFDTLHGPHGDVGLITLNRPNQLNALTYHMCRSMRVQLAQWVKEDNIKAVVICGVGDRAFCAGGDIRDVYKQREQVEKTREFFVQEYSLNRDIFHFPKPYIAFMDGITFGGGAGVSINGKYRIATEKFKFAMPETGIGFFTDVGASYFLGHLRMGTGQYLGLTGDAIATPEAHCFGLVNYQVPSEKLSDLLDALVKADWSQKDIDWVVHRAINKFWMPIGDPFEFYTSEEQIQNCFMQDSVEEVLHLLKLQHMRWSDQKLALLQTRSPTSLKVVFELLKRGSRLDFDACMQMEFRVAMRFLQGHDFYEGIRAAVIDKDRNPHWSPATLTEVSEADVAAYFAPLEHELTFEEA